MGARQSQPMVSSPSAAFGRLRIDSPAARRRLLTTTSSGNSLKQQPFARPSSSGVMKESSPLLGGGRKLGAAHESSAAAAAAGEYHMSSPDSAVVVAMKNPPVILWIGPALICALMYALYNIFIKKGSNTMHPILGGVILQFVAAILGSVLLGVLIWSDGGSTDNLDYDATGNYWSVAAGAAVGAAEILSFIVSGMGVQAMQSIPIIIGGSVLFGTTLGYTVLKEALTYRGWVGVLFIAAGIALVGTDPGGAGSVH